MSLKVIVVGIVVVFIVLVFCGLSCCSDGGHTYGKRKAAPKSHI